MPCIRGVENELFKSYLSNRHHTVTINNEHSNKLLIQHGVPQGSVLGPLLFLIYINDLHSAIKQSQTFHFADNTSLLCSNISLKKLNKNVNEDLKLLCIWLRDNKIRLNTKKTELIIFGSRQKIITKHLNFRLGGQKLIPAKQVQYLGVIIDEHLTWQSYFFHLMQKLSRATGILAKLRHYVNYDTLISIYYVLFDSHHNYSSQVWGHVTQNMMDKLGTLQNKTLRIIHFKQFRSSAKPLYMQSKILRIRAQIKFNNCVFAFQQQRRTLPTAFNNFCTPLKDVHSHDTIRNKFNLKTEKYCTETYGISSIQNQVVCDWNEIILKLQVNLDDQTMFSL